MSEEGKGLGPTKTPGSGGPCTCSPPPPGRMTGVLSTGRGIWLPRYGTRPQPHLPPRTRVSLTVQGTPEMSHTMKKTKFCVHFSPRVLTGEELSITSSARELSITERAQQPSSPLRPPPRDILLPLHYPVGFLLSHLSFCSFQDVQQVCLRRCT